VWFSGCMVVRHHTGRDAPAGADRDALLALTRPDLADALTARRGACAPAPLPPVGLAGMRNERCQLLAERPGILLVQIDLVLGAADPEPQRLLGRAAIQIVFERDNYLRCHPGLHRRLWAPLH